MQALDFVTRCMSSRPFDKLRVNSGENLKAPSQREPFIHKLNVFVSRLADCDALRSEDLAAFGEANNHSTLARKLRHIHAHGSTVECFGEEHVTANIEYLHRLSAIGGRSNVQSVVHDSHVGLDFGGSNDTRRAIVAAKSLLNKSGIARRFDPPPCLGGFFVNPLRNTFTNAIRIHGVALASGHLS